MPGVPWAEFAVFFHLRDLMYAGRLMSKSGRGHRFQLGAKDKDTNLHQAGAARARQGGAGDGIGRGDPGSGPRRGRDGGGLRPVPELSRFPIDSDFALHYGRCRRVWRRRRSIAAKRMGFYEGDGVNSTMCCAVYFLTLPMQRVCRESCKGICPLCRQNRNQKSASATRKLPTTWAALKSLKS